MTNFTDPILTTHKDQVLSILNAKIDSVSKMDYASDTNIPTNAIRWNNTAGFLEKFNGTTWTALPYGSIKAGSVTNGAIAADAVVAGNIRLANDTYLRANAVNGSAYTIAGLNASNELLLAAYGGLGVRIYDQGSSKWSIGSNILPHFAGNAQDIGGPSNLLSSLWANTYNVYTKITGRSSAADLVLNTVSGTGKFYFEQNGSRTWWIDGNAIKPQHHATNDLGSSSGTLLTVWTRYVESYAGDGLHIKGSLATYLWAAGGIQCLVADGGIFQYTPNKGVGSAVSPWTYGFFRDIGSPSYHTSTLWVSQVRNENGLDFYSKNGEMRFFGYNNLSEQMFGLRQRNWWDGYRIHPYFHSTSIFGVGDTWRVSGGSAGEVPDAWLRIEIGPGQYKAIKLWDL